MTATGKYILTIDCFMCAPVHLFCQKENVCPNKFTQAQGTVLSKFYIQPLDGGIVVLKLVAFRLK